jgi:hypothetical protein
VEWLRLSSRVERSIAPCYCTDSHADLAWPSRAPWTMSLDQELSRPIMTSGRANLSHSIPRCSKGYDHSFIHLLRTTSANHGPPSMFTSKLSILAAPTKFTLVNLASFQVSRCLLINLQAVQAPPCEIRCRSLSRARSLSITRVQQYCSERRPCNGTPHDDPCVAGLNSVTASLAKVKFQTAAAGT